MDSHTHTTTNAEDHWQIHDSIFVKLPPAELYDIVSDVTRTGQWSPVCKKCEWQDGTAQPGVVGSRFIGHNVTPSRQWDTVSEVVAADRPHEFAWIVGPDAQPGGFVRWGFRIQEADGGSTLIEDWHFHDTGREAFWNKWGDDAPAQAEDRRQAAIDGIPQTLATIKRIAEGEQ